MRKLATALIYILIFALSGCAPAIRNMDSGGSRIICFGDSITYGYGAKEGDAYPSYLAETVRREVINAGVSGETSEQGLERLEDDVLDEDPYLVIVEFGANDYFKKVPRKETEKNLEEMISRIQEEGAMVALCDVSGGAMLGAYDIYHKDLKRLARRTGSIFVPYLMKEITQSPALKSDNIHPNSKGYKIIAERVYEAIKPYL